MTAYCDNSAAKKRERAVYGDMPGSQGKKKREGIWCLPVKLQSIVLLLPQSAQAETIATTTARLAKTSKNSSVFDFILITDPPF